MNEINWKLYNLINFRLWAGYIKQARENGAFVVNLAPVSAKKCSYWKIDRISF